MASPSANLLDMPTATFESFSKAVENGLCTREQYLTMAAAVVSTRPCNLLVIGCGHDSALWTTLNAGGRTLYIEAQEHWVNAARLSGCEVELHRYGTKLGVWANDIQTPPFLTPVNWDMMIIDGPEGCCPESPGRQAPITWASRLQPPILFLHDYERPWEAYCSKKLLPSPTSVLKSRQRKRRGALALWQASP